MRTKSQSCFQARGTWGVWAPRRRRRSAAPGATNLGSYTQVTCTHKRRRWRGQYLVHVCRKETPTIPRILPMGYSDSKNPRAWMGCLSLYRRSSAQLGECCALGLRSA